MAKSRDNIALEWTRGELIATLGSARRTLEAYADALDEGSRAPDTDLRACVEALHQAHGVLVMLELPSAATFVAHLEEVASALADGTIRDPAGAAECLMQGLLELPDYLDARRPGLDDTLVPLLPVLNELRRHLKQVPLASPLVERVLSAAPSEQVLERFTAIDGLDKVRRLRAVYQQILLSVLKDSAALAAVDTLRKVALSMQRLCDGAPQAVLWQVFDEYLQALRAPAGEPPGPLGTEAVKLLRRLDSELRTLAQDGASALARPVSVDLVQQLINAAHARGHTSVFLEELQQSLSAADMSEAFASSGRRALASAAAALRDDLAAVRDRIDLLLRGALADGGETQGYESLLAPLKQISSTMSLLGLESSRVIIAEQMDVLTGPVIDAAMLDLMAEALAQVDQNLAGLSLGGKGDAELILDSAQQAVIGEARQGLELLKQAVVDYVSSQWDVRHLQSLPGSLAGIASALRMVPLPEAAALVERCVDYITGNLLGGHAPDWVELDRFAGAVSGVDYYLERLTGPSAAGAEEILEYAQRSLAALKVDPRAPAEVIPPDARSAPQADREQPPAWEGPANAETALSSEMVAGQTHGVIQPSSSDVRSVGDFVPSELALEASESDTEAAIPPSQKAFADGIDEIGAVAESVEFDEVVEDDQSVDLDVVVAGAEPAERAEAIGRVDATAPASAPASERESGPAGQGELDPEIVAVRARLAALGGDVEVDDEILAVFLEEVDDVLAAIDEHLAPWQQDIGEGQHAVELRRAFHTLKGSGRLVGAVVLGELAWAIEQILNRIIDGTIDASPQAQGVIAEARAVAPALRDAFAARAEPPVDAAAGIVVRAERIAAGVIEASVEPVVEAAEQFISAAAEPVVQVETGDTLQVFCEEAREHLAVVDAASSPSGYRIDERVARAFHTLAGSAAMAGVPVVAELARAALDLVQVLLGSREAADVDGPAAEFIASASAALDADLQDLAGRRDLADHAELIAAADLLRQQTPVDPLMREVLALPGLEALLGAQQLLEDWQREGFDATRSATLVGVLDEIVALADAPDHAALAELASALGRAHVRLAGIVLDDDRARTLLTGHERLLGQIDALVGGQPLRQASEAVAALADLEAPTPLPVPVSQPMEDVPTSALEEVDPELVAIFMEEAEELLDQIDQAVQSCVRDSDVQAAIEALLRALHTLKGGARLAGLAAAGDAAHEFESWLISTRDSALPFNSQAVSHLHDRYDGLAALVAAASGAPAAAADYRPEPAIAVEAAAETPEPCAEPDIVAEAGAVFGQAPVEPAADSAQVDQSAPSWILPALGSAQEPAHAETAAGSAEAPRALPAAVDRRALERSGERLAEEVVRVRASLLDQLVNLAGESSIIRGRVQQGLSGFGSALDEMEMTIQRLREQLRRLEIETEAQILFRRELLDSSGNEDFDPLELDRYSQLQQLSRSLSESASDMLDLKETLRLRAGETETLLVQQSRINTQLQEGLMRSRMVPFAQLLPRLRRTVRQAAQDLGKSVELVAYNVEGELDRSLLDRMIAPLEHMLRNAVDHGIERPDERRAAAKRETGQIEIRLSREAGDVVIEIRDDGAGIDVARVRAKALDQGIIAPDADLTDDEICQFVFAPGFSTARSVTQISGRGVGMDVALSEVKQLGGSIGLTSEPGRGTAFLVRVPFTVSVNRALMVSVGEDLYAVPLNTIEGVVLARGDELAELSRSDRSWLQYAGVAYQVRHLGEYLGRSARAGGASGSVPVVLVRSGESAVAVQVDSVQGSREIVVKGLGPQFAGVAGISGATVLGDGGVVVILDLPALVRARRDGAVVERKRSATAARARSVLVVDDSVTVRKVTTRLLERQGMEVMLAKDGVEAVAILQERKPDIMLLDIEMPRMDGFEVLRHVRHDANLADLPVIMISSRTGAKHKDRAAELGVSHFLGKPFQEAQLLAVIDQFLK